MGGGGAVVGSKNENLGPCTKLNQKCMVKSSGWPHQNVSIYFFYYVQEGRLVESVKQGWPNFFEHRIIQVFLDLLLTPSILILPYYMLM